MWCGMTTQKLIPCRICGKLFDSKHGSIYCSDECRKIAIKEQTKRRSGYYREYYKKQRTEKKTKKRKSEISDINAEARALGMTYGQYQAMKYLKEGGNNG